MIHQLKIHPEPFFAIAQRKKFFEYRKDDREPAFALGDILHLRLYIPEYNTYPGDEFRAMVSYIARGRFGIPDGYAVLSLDPPSIEVNWANGG